MRKLRALRGGKRGVNVGQRLMPRVRQALETFEVDLLGLNHQDVPGWVACST
jgi:hypothetical protein